MGTPIAISGTKVSIQPATSPLQALSLRVPGDISSAVPWLVLAACHPDAEVVLEGVNVNQSRTGILDILTAMGASIELMEERTSGGEPVADMVVRSSRLQATTVSGALVPRAIDELPLVALLGCFAEGDTVVRDAAELRVKESDRIEALVEVLGRMGAHITVHPDGFTVHGPAELHGARVDGRIAVLDGDTTPDAAVKGLAPLASHVAFSQGGLQQFSGVTDPETGLRVAEERLSGWLCVTLGADGCLVLEKGAIRAVPAFPIEAVDTTGAGDVFHGALAVALAEGRDALAAVQFASAAAALKCTRFGGRHGIPDRPQVEAFMAHRPFGAG